MNQLDVDEWVADFRRRHPAAAHLRDRVFDVSGRGGRNPDASHTGRGIELGPKFWTHDRATQDWIFAHEIGHGVLDRWGLSNLVSAASARGIDVWDTLSLPFGNGNMHEAFADCFASYVVDGDVKRRYPEWVPLVEEGVGQGRAASRCAMPSDPGYYPTLGTPEHPPSIHWDAMPQSGPSPEEDADERTGPGARGMGDFWNGQQRQHRAAGEKKMNGDKLRRVARLVLGALSGPVIQTEEGPYRLTYEVDVEEERFAVFFGHSFTLAGDSYLAQELANYLHDVALKVGRSSRGRGPTVPRVGLVSHETYEEGASIYFGASFTLANVDEKALQQLAQLLTAISDEMIG